MVSSFLVLSPSCSSVALRRAMPFVNSSARFLCWNWLILFAPLCAFFSIWVSFVLLLGLIDGYSTVNYRLYDRLCGRDPSIGSKFDKVERFLMDAVDRSTCLISYLWKSKSVSVLYKTFLNIMLQCQWWIFGNENICKQLEARIFRD